MSDRDQHVDRLLREAMAGPVRAESADCLDVETLAAWSEGSLRTDDRALAETHAATCTRCQHLLAAMIRTEPTVAAAAPSPFRKWLVMLGPALGAAAAVALWFAVDPAPTRVPTQMVSLEKSTASADQQKNVAKERELAAPSSQAAPGDRPESRLAAGSSSRPREVEEADKTVRDADERKRAAEPSPKLFDRLADAKRKSMDGPSSGAPRAEATDNAPPMARALPAPPPPTPPPPAAPPLSARQDRGQESRDLRANEGVNQTANQPLSQQQVQALPSPSQNAAQNVVSPPPPASGERRVSEAPAAPTTTTTTTVTAASQPGRDSAAYDGRGQGRAGGVQGFMAETVGGSLGTFDVPTSTPSTRYRALNGRTIQRSIDAGTTWTTLRMLAPPAVVIAGVSPAPTVCWLAGTGGIVLSTADGVTWREAKLPEPGEIKTIAAVDGTSATVTMADGRTLTTTNGGTSWARPR